MVLLKPLTYITAIVCLCLLYNLCSAQDKAKNTWGKITPADFAAVQSSVADSNAGAIILSDIGTVNFIGNSKSWFSYVFKRQTRIRILDQRGMEAGKVSVFLLAPDEDAEKISNVEATTYNLDNGTVVQAKLDPKDVFVERENKSYLQAKFALPGIKSGSIIEYTYTITSDHYAFLKPWQFQWEKYPCLWSECQVEIPQAMYYVIVRQGVHPYAVDKGSQGNSSYRIVRKADPSRLGMQDQSIYVSAVTIKHDWAMKDVPAFGSEPYLTTPENYLDKISFQLSKTYNGDEYRDFSNSWANLNEMLLRKDNFGLPLEPENDWLSGTVDKITADKNDPLEQAKAVYYNLTGRLTCTNYYNPYITTNFNDVLKKNGGTVGDINLLLVAMLRRRGLRADPVLLSTRENGFTVASYPVLGRLNYVIARLKLGGKVFYLDAARPQLGFGQLPADCYNGYARIISNTDSGSVWLWSDSLKEKKVTMVLTSLSDKGLEGSWQSTLGPEESYRLRRDIARQGEDAWFKALQTNWGEDIDIQNGGIDSLHQPEEPVNVHYEFVLKQPAGTSVYYLNPMFGEGYRENPFKAADRKYPVEMPYAIDKMYIFSMEIPAGYDVEELPKSAKVAFNVDQGSFEYLVAHNGNQVQFRCRLKLNRATFQPEDYSTLRDFFAFVVKKENEQIVLKKK